MYLNPFQTNPMGMVDIQGDVVRLIRFDKRIARISEIKLNLIGKIPQDVAVASAED